MQAAPFSPMGNSFTITVGAASQSVPVLYNPSGGGGLGLGSTEPPQIRLLNTGTAMVWISFSSPAAVAAVIPTAGTTTLGTPQLVSWAAPGVEFSLTLPVAIQGLTGVTGRQDQPTGFWMNVIAAAAGQLLQCQLGDGI